MCSLISERPNLVPAVIGNGNSTIDMNILLSGVVMMATDDLDMMATDDLDMMALPNELSGSDQDGGLLMAEDEDIGVDEEKIAVKKEKLVIPKKRAQWQAHQENKSTGRII